MSGADYDIHARRALVRRLAGATMMEQLAAAKVAAKQLVIPEEAVEAAALMKVIDAMGAYLYPDAWGGLKLE